MKTYKNLYEKIISEENLKKAFYAAAKGKKNRRDVRQIRRLTTDSSRKSAGS